MMIFKLMVFGLVFVMFVVVLVFVIEMIKVVVIDGYLVWVFWVKEFMNFFIFEVDKCFVMIGNYKMDW